MKDAVDADNVVATPSVVTFVEKTFDVVSAISDVGTSVEAAELVACFVVTSSVVTFSEVALDVESDVARPVVAKLADVTPSEVTT